MKKKRQQVCIKDHNIIHTNKKTGSWEAWKDMKERKKEKKCHREEELREN